MGADALEDLAARKAERRARRGQGRVASTQPAGEKGRTWDRGRYEPRSRARSTPKPDRADWRAYEPLWEAIVGKGSVFPVRYAEEHLSPLIASHGHAEVQRRLAIYGANTPPQFAGFAAFASKWGLYDGRPLATGRSTMSTAEKNMVLVRRMLSEGKENGGEVIDIGPTLLQPFMGALR